MPPMINPRTHLTLAALIGLGSLAAVASAAPAHGRTCHGLPVTIAASTGEVHGTSHADVIALRGASRVWAGAGNDIICGSQRADVIDAGPGADVVVGGGGSDHLSGGPGSDRLFGDRGADHLVGGPGADYLMGGAGRDVVVRQTATHSGRHHMELGRPVPATADTVVAGTSAVSLVVDSNTLQFMYGANYEFGMAWVPGMGAPPIVWNTFQPLFANMASLTGQLAAYVAPGAGQVVPDTIVQPASTVSVAPGTAWNANVNAAPMLWPAGGGAASSVTINNQGTEPTVAGLARQSMVNGSGQMSPITAITLWGNMAAVMSVPTQITMFATDGMVSPGQVMINVPTPNAVARAAAGTDTAQMSFNINTGFSQDS